MTPKITDDKFLETYLGGLSGMFQSIECSKVALGIWEVLHKLSVSARMRATQLEREENQREIDDMLGRLDKLEHKQRRRDMKIIPGGCRPDRRRKRKPELRIVTG